MLRLVEGAVAVGFGAADAFVQAKSGNGPGGVPWVVYFEGLGAAAGLFGDKIGLSREIADPLEFAGMKLAGARLSHAASSGALMQGPKAWGGAVGAYSARTAAKAAPAGLPPGADQAIRMLPGRSFTQSAFSQGPTLVEAAGMMG
jgi:hypothetical protein